MLGRDRDVFENLPAYRGLKYGWRPEGRRYRIIRAGAILASFGGREMTLESPPCFLPVFIS